MSIKKWMISTIFLCGCSAAQTPVEYAHEPVDAEPAELEEIQAEPENAQCPKDLISEPILHGVTQEMLDVGYWLGNERVVMTHDEILAQNRRFYAVMNDLDAAVPREILREQLVERLNSFREKFENGEITFVDGSVPDLADFERPLKDFDDQFSGQAEVSGRQYILLEDATILCAPHDAPYIKSVGGEVRFSRNSCSLARAQSRVEVFWENTEGLRLIRTRDMWGWLSADAKLGPEVTGDASFSARDGRWFSEKSMELAGMPIGRGAFVAGTDDEIEVATESGFVRFRASEVPGMVDTHRDLTRDAWIRTLFLFLGDPYGWGGWGSWRDCSRLLLDAARSFGLWLPRNSKEQAVSASYYLKVAGMGREAKLAAIEAAANTGIVFLHFPGHMMAWIGRSAGGTPIILHALSEHLQACPNGEGRSLVHVDRVVLSDLSLGEGTARGDFLDRITHVAVFTPISRSVQKNGQTAWEATRGWTPEEETLFAAFVERLFDYPDERDKTWTNLGDVLRDKKHNILYNALGENEDDHLVLEPDCADLPYMLRSYFAWKRGLPMASRKCGRGSSTKPPKCGKPEYQDAFRIGGNAARRYNQYAIALGGYRVQSGNARTALDDSETDFYPVALDRESLRPGVIYADPYGHLLVIAHYQPDTKEEPGLMFSVDAQPDGTITRKRFWRGNFLFAPEIKGVGAGFKAFRPIVDGSQLSNDALNSASGFVPFSMEQGQISREVFYDRVEAAIHPVPLSIQETIDELVQSLWESAQKRLLSVQNGDDFANEHGGSIFVMPSGYAAFETEGPWEDYATPSRDMRMLTAIDSVRDFPDRVRRNAARYGLQTEDDIERAVSDTRSAVAEALSQKMVTYINSVKEPVTISMQDVVDRVDALEMAYHPGDCNEIRWGAPEDSDEYRTCSRRISPAEQKKMELLRPYFHMRIRPPR